MGSRFLELLKLFLVCEMDGSLSPSVLMLFPCGFSLVASPTIGEDDKHDITFQTA